MATAKPIEHLSAAQSYGEAAAKVISIRAGELRERARGVLDTADVERLHDMRVATRRLRAALEVFKPCFPGRPHRRVLREVKRLADGLGERRDRDVAIATLRRFNEQMPAADRPGIESLIGRLRDEQEEANLRLGPLVDQGNLTALDQGLQELVTAARGRAGAEPSASDEGGR